MTTTDPDAPITLQPGSAVEQARGLSVLERAAKRREARVKDEFLTMDVPTWRGELKAKYKVVQRADLEKMIKRIQDRKEGTKPGDGIEADLDFLIKACVSVVAFDIDAEVTDEDGEEVSKGYAPGLASMLDDPAGTDTARGLVQHLFNQNGIAIAAHAQKLARWMQDTSKPVEDPQ